MNPLRRPYPALALAFLMTLVTMSGAQPLLAGALTVPEVVSLLKAGVGEKVILAQVRASGARPALGAREILQLKQAGASDDLLEALVGMAGRVGVVDNAPPAFSPASTAKGGIRVYRSVGPDGQEILNITNLDEAGNRIGGELPPEPPAPSAPPSSRPVAYSGHDEAGVRDTPIVVNVYPPTSGGADGSGDGYDGGTTGYLGGLYPGYLGTAGYGSCYNCPGSSHDGHHGHNGHRQPRFDDGGLFSRPSAIDTRPYRAGTAAQRNRIRFRN